MKTIASHINRFVAVTLLISGSAAIATDLDLELKVSGSIASVPQWRNDKNEVITSVDLSFANNKVGLPETNVDSTESTISLFNISSDNTTAALTTPTNCAIGETKVLDEHVKLMVGADTASTNDRFDFSTAKKIKLRLSSAGKYGDKSGVVKCDSGKFNYVY